MTQNFLHWRHGISIEYGMTPMRKWAIVRTSTPYSRVFSHIWWVTRSGDEVGAIVSKMYCYYYAHINAKRWVLREPVNRPIRLTQCCTQFKPFGNKTFCFRNFHIIFNVNATLYCKYNTQRILYPGDLNWVQHWVSRIGLFKVLRFFKHTLLDLPVWLFIFQVLASNYNPINRI